MASLESCNVYSNNATKVCSFPFQPFAVVIWTKSYAPSCVWHRLAGDYPSEGQTRS